MRNVGLNLGEKAGKSRFCRVLFIELDFIVSFRYILS